MRYDITQFNYKSINFVFPFAAGHPPRFLYQWQDKKYFPEIEEHYIQWAIQVVFNLTKNWKSNNKLEINTIFLILSIELLFFPQFFNSLPFVFALNGSLFVARSLHDGKNFINRKRRWGKYCKWKINEPQLSYNHSTSSIWKHAENCISMWIENVFICK